MPTPTLVSIALVLVTSALLVVSGLKKQPGLGVIASLVIIALALWLRGENLASVGFRSPENWAVTLLLGLVLGAVIQLLSIVLIEPISEKLTRTRHDHSIVDGVKGNWKAFAQWMLVVWLLVAFLEEFIYRGFLMTEIAKVIGLGPAALLFSVLFSSLVFGLSHGYQERCGILSTGIIGVFLALIFVWSGFNLWLAIFTHGFIDTLGIALIAVGGDKALRQKVWGAQA